MGGVLTQSEAACVLWFIRTLLYIALGCWWLAQWQAQAAKQSTGIVKVIKLRAAIRTVHRSFLRWQ
jgi:hypothetical protein